MEKPYTGPITAEHQSAWLAAHQEYRRLRALLEADEAFGHTARAGRDIELRTFAVEYQFGTREAALRNPEANRKLDELYDADTVLSDRQMREFIEPVDAAAIRLVAMPAPDLDAAILKIEIVKREKLDNHSDFPGEPFDFIAADLARFAQGGAA